jgi:NAD(P)-dependent dehydrogenase (short-subunit alcohol dehydrogenase family)
MAESRLRILVVGASGTIGKAIVAELKPRHDIVAVGRKSGEINIDIADPASIRDGLKKAGQLDAVVCAAGGVTFAPLDNFKSAPFGESLHTTGITSKLLGQVNLALAARDVLKDRGSITLTSGILSEQPIAAGSSASMVNAAIDAWVHAAAIEMPRGIRINVVSPTLVTESLPAFGPFFRGFETVPTARVALAYSRSVEGLQTGQVYKVFGGG